MGDQRTIQWKVAGRTYTAPVYWLMGRQHAHERDGLDPRRAYRAALLDWETYEDLARLSEPPRPRTPEGDEV